MRRVIRRGVFETNSSSVHSLVICTDDEYKDWERGNLMLWGESFDTKENIIANLKTKRWYESYDFGKMSENEWSEFCNDNDIYTWESWDRYVMDRYYETFEDAYTTPKGETIHVFGYYGHD